jgi:hypothetical protein
MTRILSASVLAMLTSIGCATIAEPEILPDNAESDNNGSAVVTPVPLVAPQQSACLADCGGPDSTYSPTKHACVVSCEGQKLPCFDNNDPNTTRAPVGWVVLKTVNNACTFELTSADGEVTIEQARQTTDGSQIGGPTGCEGRHDKSHWLYSGVSFEPALLRVEFNYKPSFPFWMCWIR